MRESRKPTIQAPRCLAAGGADSRQPEAVELNRAENVNRTLFSIANAVNTTLNLPDLYRSIHRSLAGIIDVTNFFIAIVDSKKRTLYFPYHVDTRDEDFEPIADFDTHSSLAGLVVLKRRPVLLRQAELEARSAQGGVWGPVPRVWMGVPLIIKDAVTGVVALQSYTDPDMYSEQDLQVLSAVSHQIAIAIDRKRAERALEESEKRLRAILESSPDPIVVYDTQGHPQYLNPAFTKRFGWSSAEVQGKPIPFVPADQQEITAAKIRELYRTKRPVRFETRRCTKSGEVRDILISAGPILGIGEALAGMVVTLADITEKNRLTEQFHAVQRLESIGTLAGGIAHDFNNLLTGILGHASLLAAEIDPSGQAVEHLKGIEKYVRDATDLTKQLLGFARGGKFEVKPTNIGALIEKQSRLFGRTRKEIKIRENFASDTRTVEVDRGQIEQVLLNLYVNAWQAMPGGGDLYVQTGNVVLDSNDIASAGDYVKISITDTGVGMDEATRQRIFDPFFTTKEMGRGTGLGLASVYGIIKNHGGRINVESEKGHGTTFSIYLPASDKDVVEEPRQDKRILQGSETILLVDDESVIVEVGQKLLERLGYTVRVARSGQEAIEIYRAGMDRIDIVILDMIMPGMDGGKTFERLKALNADVKVLLASGYSFDGQARSIIDRGCSGFIQKPFTLNALSVKIRQIIASA